MGIKSCDGVPKDCDSQIKMGLSIVTNAFKAKVKSLEDDLRAVAEERAELEEKFSLMTARLQKYERERRDWVTWQEKAAALEQKLAEKSAELEDLRAEMRRRENDLTCENKRLSTEIANLKRKASQLETFRRVIIETMKNEEDGARLPAGGDFYDDPYSNTARNHHSSYDYNSTTTTGSEPGGPKPPASGDSEGRKLFALARSRLTLDQFARFVDCVKRLNGRNISPEESLEEVEDLCGPAAADLSNAFRTLLMQRSRSRHPFSSPYLYQ